MRVKVIVDRFEQDKAVLEIHEYRYKIILPVHVLPRGVKEGDILNLEVKRSKRLKREGISRKKKSRQLLNRILKKR